MFGVVRNSEECTVCAVYAAYEEVSGVLLLVGAGNVQTPSSLKSEQHDRASLSALSEPNIQRVERTDIRPGPSEAPPSHRREYLSLKVH